MKTSIFRSISILALSAHLIGCASGPTRPEKIDNKRTLNVSFDHVWTNALQTLASDGYPVQTSNKEAGIITTGKLATRPDTSVVDCGTYMGLPYIKDHRTVTSIGYSILLKNLGNNKTSAVVNTNIDATFQAGSNTKNLTCFSQGKLEAELLNKLSQ